MRTAYSLIIALSIVVGCGATEQLPTPVGEFTWGVFSDHPPIFITQGPNRGRGMADQAYSVLQRELPYHQHSLVHAKIKRIIAMISSGDKICSVMIKTPARERLALFSSQAIALLPSPRLVIAADKKEYFRQVTGWQGESISVPKLIKEHKNLRLGLVEGSTYGPTLDAQLKKLNDANYAYRHSGFNSPRAVLRMLLAGRVDYILEYSWAINYMIRDEIRKVTLIPISHIPPYYKAFIACPKNRWGKSAIDQINPIIKQVRQANQSSVEYWLPSSALADYRKYYREYFQIKE